MRRWACRILISLILGGVTTVAVAWGCARWIYVDPMNPTYLRDSGVLDVGQMPFGGGVSLMHRSRAGASNLWAMRSGSGKPVSSPWDVLPAWSAIPERVMRQYDISRAEMSRLEAEGEGRNVVPSFVFEMARGWPVVSMRTIWDGGISYLPTAGGPYTGEYALPPEYVVGGIDLEPFVPDAPGSVSLDNHRALPLQPIWHGSLLDTLFYAVIWFFPLNWRALRQHIHRRCGRCPACGYDLRHDFETGCPECGWNRA